ADMGLDVERRNLRPEEEAPDVGGDAEIREPQFLDGVDRDDLPAAPADVHQGAEEPRVIGGGIAADHDEQVGLLDIFKSDGRGARAEALTEADAARLVA